MATVTDESPREAAEHELDGDAGHDDAHGKPAKPTHGGPHGTHGKPAAAAGKKKDHKQLIVIVVSVVGVIIAWISYKSSQNKAAADDPTMTGTSPYAQAANGQAAAGGNVAGAGDPSSTAGFASYLANLQAEIDGLQTAVDGFTPTPVVTPPTGPVLKPPSQIYKPHFIYGAAAKGLKYIRNRATGAFYQVQPNGSLYKLNPVQYAELGNPHASASFGAAKKKPTPKPKPK